MIGLQDFKMIFVFTKYNHTVHIISCDNLFRPRAVKHLLEIYIILLWQS